MSVTKTQGKRRNPAKFIMTPLRMFFQTSSAGGVVLMITTIIALMWANSGVSHSYFSLWQQPVGFRLGGFELQKPFFLWINDGLMAIFFFLIGLEIKREIMHGELRSVKQSLMPVLAALGGMAVPGLFYTVFNIGEPTIRGWAIPTATDIAFSLGILSLLGTRAPHGLKVFLATLAIVDDLLAIVVIAVFYTEKIKMMSLMIAVFLILVLLVLNLLKIRKSLPYLLLGVLLWLAVLKSGVHATLAGVVLAFLIPAREKIDTEQFYQRINFVTHRIATLFNGKNKEPDHDPESKLVSSIDALERACDDVQSPSLRLEHKLHPWVAFLIMPLFALANAGLVINADTAGALFSEAVGLGTFFGLLLGKPIGIILFVLIAWGTRLANLPHGTSWVQIIGLGFLCGIGFTMSLFIADLAFVKTRENLEAAKAAILGASLLTGLIGYSIIRWGNNPEAVE